MLEQDTELFIDQVNSITLHHFHEKKSQFAFEVEDFSPSTCKKLRRNLANIDRSRVRRNHFESHQMKN